MAGARVLGDVRCHLGEGPVYDPHTATLWWFDILGRQLIELPFPDGPAIVHDLPLIASALMRIDERRQLLVTESGLQVRDRRTGALTLHTPHEADRPDTRSNDARAHPCGAVWVGTMGKAAEHRAGAIYWFRAGEVRQLFDRISIPNSICFSPDGAIAYFTDTMKGILFRVDCDPATGLPIGEPQVFVDHRGKQGGLDGSVVDADGIVWNTRWGGGCVDAYGPQGQLLRSLPVPARQTSCPAFAGPRLDRLVVTSAWEHMDDAARAADPLAGATFLLDVVVRGRAEPDVAL